MPNIKKEIKLADGLVLETDQYVEKYKTAKALGLSTKQLNRITKEGGFHTTQIGKKTYYSLSEIVDYKNRKNNIDIPFNGEFLSRLYGKSSRLEERIKMIERVLDMYYEPIELTNLQLHALYKSAVERDLVNSERSLQSWGEIFLRLNETHFMQLYKYLDDDKPWKPFLELAYLCYAVARRRGFLELRRFLAKGVKNVKSSSIIFLEMTGKTYKKMVNVARLKEDAKKIKYTVLRSEKKDTEEVM